MTEQVWKTTETEYYTSRNMKGVERACRRTVVTWTARINGRVVHGFNSKRQALAAIAHA